MAELTRDDLEPMIETLGRMEARGTLTGEGQRQLSLYRLALRALDQEPDAKLGARVRASAMGPHGSYACCVGTDALTALREEAPDADR